MFCQWLAHLRAHTSALQDFSNQIEWIIGSDSPKTVVNTPIRNWLESIQLMFIAALQAYPWQAPYSKLQADNSRFHYLDDS